MSDDPDYVPPPPPAPIDDEADNTIPTLEDLFNPYKYKLKNIHVKPSQVGQPLGLETKTWAPHIVQVTDVKGGGIANQLGIGSGSYLLTTNGRMATGDKNADPNGIRMGFLKKRSSPLHRLLPSFFLGQYKRQRGFEYPIIRLNLIKCKSSDLDIVNEKGGRVCIGANSNQKVLKESGLQIGDTVISANDMPSRNKLYLEEKFRDQDLVDLVIERPQSMEPLPPIKAYSEPEFTLDASASDARQSSSNTGTAMVAATGSDEEEEDEDPFGPEKIIPSDPSAGVPKHVPSDVQRHVQGTAQALAKRIINAKTIPNAPKMKIAAIGVKQSQPKLTAKINKTVAATKLKKPSSSSKSKSKGKDKK